MSQGSILGPLLDLTNISKILNFYLFADDTNIYYENDSMEEMEKMINAELIFHKGAEKSFPAKIFLEHVQETHADLFNFMVVLILYHFICFML